MTNYFLPMLITDEQLKKLVISVKLLDDAGFKKVAEYAKNTEIALSDALIEKDVVTD